MDYRSAAILNPLVSKSALNEDVLDVFPFNRANSYGSSKESCEIKRQPKEPSALCLPLPVPCRYGRVIDAGLLSHKNSNGGCEAVREVVLVKSHPLIRSLGSGWIEPVTRCTSIARLLVREDAIM